MNNSGYVYLIAGDQGWYKIGRTVNLQTRLYGLRREFGEIEVVHTIETDDAPQLEANLHERFADKRTEREWFDLDQSDIVEFKECDKHIFVSEPDRFGTQEKRILARIPSELHDLITKEAHRQRRSIHNQMLYMMETYFDSRKMQRRMSELERTVTATPDDGDDE